MYVQELYTVMYVCTGGGSSVRARWCSPWYQPASVVSVERVSSALGRATREVCASRLSLSLQCGPSTWVVSSKSMNQGNSSLNQGQ